MQRLRVSKLRYLFGIAALSLAFASDSRAEPQWREYAYPDQQFAVSFPAAPAVTTVRSGEPEARGVTKTVYLLQQEDGSFEVAVFDLLLARLDEPTAIARAAASLRRNAEVIVDIASEVQGHWG